MDFLLLFNERNGHTAARRSRSCRDEEVRRRAPEPGRIPARRAAGSRVRRRGVRVRDGKAFVTDGPFAETKELIAGFWIVDVADRAEALEIARRCPHAQRGPIELHVLRDRHTFTDSENGAAFLLAFRMEPGLSDPDGAKLREMIAFAQAFEREGTIFEIAPLGDDPPAARIEAKAGKVLVTDGPFAETKEMIGGYSLVRAKGRAAAIELAQRYPHARWGPVEVREILFFDPV